MADDMFVSCVAENSQEGRDDSLNQHVDGVMEEALRFIRNIGGDAQVHECAIVASDPKLRKTLIGKVWGTEKKPVPVATDIWDLGSRFSCWKRPTANALKARVEAAIPIAKRFGAMRLTTARWLRALKTHTSL